ncbi:hypothetical protein OG365_36610 [Streptomyces sp. NBC_00853]|uniref:hypothetical protein n=1 Tax=Streptomyces sp. NBC_00853 TaxID=2903681 RepID=UPI00387361CB|nr:hypothetical protein OG365_36610 [Streptomyces sp. NBC_00853]
MFTTLHTPGRRLSQGSGVAVSYTSGPAPSPRAAAARRDVAAPLRKHVPEYRGGAHARADVVDLVVDHHRDGTLLARGSVHRFVPALERAAAGFRWTWWPNAGVGRSGGPVRGFAAGARGVRRPSRVRRPS